MAAAVAKQLTWVITGASSGIGLEVVKQVAARGDKVFATCRKKASSASGVDAISAISGDVTIIEGVDIADDGVGAVLASSPLAGVSIDVIMHNAGSLNGTRDVAAPFNLHWILRNAPGSFFLLLWVMHVVVSKSLRFSKRVRARHCTLVYVWPASSAPPLPKGFCACSPKCDECLSDCVDFEVWCLRSSPEIVERLGDLLRVP